MAYKAFITYLACGATIACSQKHKFSVSFLRYNAYIKLNREICNELLDGRKVGHFLITIQKSFKLIIN